MSRESALWQRLKKAGDQLRLEGYDVHQCRIENSAMSGHPDVEQCIDGKQSWIENKVCARPKRADSALRPKLRRSQSIWFRKRTRARCKDHYLLIQVGEAYDSILYLVPGKYYDWTAKATERQLAELSVVVTPKALEILRTIQHL